MLLQLRDFVVCDTSLYIWSSGVYIMLTKSELGILNLNNRYKKIRKRLPQSFEIFLHLQQCVFVCVCVCMHGLCVCVCVALKMILHSNSFLGIN